MTQYPKAYEAVARNIDLSDMVFEFIERILTLDGLTQQMLISLDTEQGTSETGPTTHRLEIKCAAKNSEIYQNLETFLSKQLAGYQADNIETEERPVYVTRSGREISGTRKKVTFRLYPHKFDEIARKFGCGKWDISNDEGMEATYATRTHATLLVYNKINLNFVEEKGDYVIEKKENLLSNPENCDKFRLFHD